MYFESPHNPEGNDHGGRWNIHLRSRSGNCQDTNVVRVRSFPTVQNNGKSRGKQL